jgi:hypothetical protein
LRTTGLVAVGVAMIVLAACGGANSESTESRESAQAVPARLASNQRVLTRAQSLELVRWAERLRACVTADGIELAEIRAQPRQIILATRRHHTAQELADGSIACGDRLGGPPEGSSLQVARSGFVLYLPLRCLLDEQVRRAHS